MNATPSVLMMSTY